MRKKLIQMSIREGNAIHIFSKILYQLCYRSVITTSFIDKPHMGLDNRKSMIKVIFKTKLNDTCL